MPFSLDSNKYDISFFNGVTSVQSSIFVTAFQTFDPHCYECLFLIQYLNTHFLNTPLLDYGPFEDIGSEDFDLILAMLAKQIGELFDF